MDYRRTVAAGGGMERDEAARFILCCGVVLFTWLVIGARPAYSLMSVDGVDNLLPIYATLSRVAGDWHALGYRLEDFGGANLLGTYGLMPVSILLARLDVPPLWNLNLSLLFIQACFAYLALATVRAIAGRRDRALSIAGLVETACVTWMLAFTPLLAWRIQAGHLTYIVALAVLQAMLAVVACHWHGARARVTLVIAFVTAVNGLCMQGYQILLYALAFGAPLLVASWMTLAAAPVSKPALPTLGFSLCAALACTLMAMPVFAEMLRYSLGGDAPRAPGGSIVTYSYIVSTWRDWLSALGWWDHGIARRPAAVLHEVDYGMGPLLLLAVPLALRGYWKAVAGLAISLAACFVFSTDVHPVADWLTRYVPLMGDFRVPARAVMPVMVIWGCVAFGLLRRLPAGEADTKRTAALGVLAGVAAIGSAWLPTAAAEALAWLVAAGALAGLSLRRRSVWVPLTVAAAILSVAAFAAKITFTRDAAANLVQNRELGQLLTRLAPPLASPFNRADVDVLHMGLYTAAAGNISAINGYGFPDRRFSMLFQLLTRGAWSPTQTLFNANRDEPGFHALQQLYNLRYAAGLSGGHPFVRRLPDTPGPAWASARQIRLSNMQAMAHEIAARTGSPDWSATQLIEHKARIFDHTCGTLEFTSLLTSRHGRDIRLVPAAPPPAPCPVTVAMTFAHSLSATAITASGARALQTYPAYGALLGFVLPAGARAVVITTVAGFDWVSAGLALAGLAIATLLVRGFRARSPVQPSE